MGKCHVCTIITCPESSICVICVNLNIICVFNQNCYLFGNKIGRQFGLFSEKINAIADRSGRAKYELDHLSK